MKSGQLLPVAVSRAKIKTESEVSKAESELGTAQPLLVLIFYDSIIF